MKPPGCGRHSHGLGHYYALPGLERAHRHPVGHSLDYVLEEHWRAYLAGATSAWFRVSDPVLQFLTGAMLGGIGGLLVAAKLNENLALVPLLVGAFVGWRAAAALATRQLDIINYVDGGSRFGSM